MSTVTSGVNQKEPSQRQRLLFVARYRQLVFPILLFLLTFLPRVLTLVARSTVWHTRAESFMQALAAGEWGATILAPHPGVITMWLAGLARWIGTAIVPNYNQLSLVQQMFIEIIPLEVVISLCLVLVYFLLTRLFDQTAAAVATLLLALDPFHILISKTLHVDGLMSAFVMIAALTILLFIRREKPDRRLLVVSGFFAGLALLTKVPSLFLVPFFFLCVGVRQATDLLTAEQSTFSMLFQWRLWVQPAQKIGRFFLLWILPLVVTFVLLWPAMWSEPGAALARIVGRSSDHIANPHPKPILFLGQSAIRDPGIFYYPVVLLINTTVITLPFFLVSLYLLFSRKLNRDQQLTIGLMVAFVLFFVVQMTLGEKKSSRYILPAFQFVTLMAGIGAVNLVRMWNGRLRRSTMLVLLLVVAIQFAVSIPRHPYYGTHYNLLLGGPETILPAGIVAGQDQDEGVAFAANYLNGLPNAADLKVGAQGNTFARYFHGKTKDIDANNVEYLVFTRRVLRDIDDDLWLQYRAFRPELVVTFDDVPYVWVYKARAAASAAAVLNVGEDIRLLGYDVWPMQVKPGETVQVTVYWEAVHQPAGDFTVFAHLLDEADQVRAQQDNAPVDGRYPTYQWPPGAFIRDEYELQVLPDASPGKYQIALGMYVWQTLERLPVTTLAGEVQPENRLVIDGVRVIAPTYMEVNR